MTERYRIGAEACSLSQLSGKETGGDGGAAAGVSGDAVDGVAGEVPDGVGGSEVGGSVTKVARFD